MKKGIHFDDTFSPCTRLETLCIITVVAINNNWNISHADVPNAYLHEECENLIFTRLPKHWNKLMGDTLGKDGDIVVLVKTLYGTPHAGHRHLLQTPQWQTALPRPWHHQLRPSLQTHATQQQQNTTTSHNVRCHIQLHRLWSLLVWIHFLSQQLSVVMEIMHLLVCTMLTPHGQNHCLLSSTQHHTLGHTTSQTHSTTHVPTHTHAHGLINNDENHAQTTHHQLSKTFPPQILQNNGTSNRKHHKASIPIH